MKKDIKVKQFEDKAAAKGPERRSQHWSSSRQNEYQGPGNKQINKIGGIVFLFSVFHPFSACSADLAEARSAFD